jgi:hypothetical protein
METPGGSGEIQFLGHSNEVFQMPEFHRTGADVSAAVLLALVNRPQRRLRIIIGTPDILKVSWRHHIDIIQAFCPAPSFH